MHAFINIKKGICLVFLEYRVEGFDLWPEQWGVSMSQSSVIVRVHQT